MIASDAHGRVSASDESQLSFHVITLKNREVVENIVVTHSVVCVATYQVVVRVGFHPCSEIDAVVIAREIDTLEFKTGGLRTLT